MLWKKSRVVYIDMRWLIIKIVALFLFIMTSVTYWKWTQVTIVEFESTELESAWKVTNRLTIKKICEGIKNSKEVPENRTLSGGNVVRLRSKMETREIIFDKSGYLIDRKKRVKILPNKELKSYLLLAEGELRKRSPFGEILNWEEVREIFQVGSTGLITDIDTDQRFSVQRTGGYSHADIEPISAEDTAVVRALYDSGLNWKRRAVVLETGKSKIAASLTGAPHGQGKNKENDFTGKMGLYFSGSEKAGGTNLSHRVMIWKAGGKTRQYITQLTPEETIMVLFTALDQRDLKTTEILIKSDDMLKESTLKQLIGVTVRNIRKTGKMKYHVLVSVSFRTGPYNQLRSIEICLAGDTDTGVYANPDFLNTLLKT